MKVVMIEDEFPAQKRLTQLLHKIDSSIEILVKLDSVENSVAWFNQNSDYDIVFMDIQLADGLSLSIFKQVEITKPVIFTTAFDEYALEAFEVSSVDYLLKPINEQRLRKSFEKIKQLQKHDQVDVLNLIKNFAGNTNHFKSRFLVKVGNVMHPISTSKIALFFIENQLTRLMTKKRNIYVVDNTLDEIEQKIDPKKFFRINRQMIVSADAIVKIEPYFSNRLMLEIDPKHDDVIVSKRKVAQFKEWLE
jgi:DNA-binding LytR/AlgR family response regulator